ncbi:hypothetical protein LTS10_012108 [Elasticomyces elasticus]|nr:hypothetical protein LTS10_012108 [Elasticomyces elasticus]
MVTCFLASYGSRQNYETLSTTLYCQQIRTLLPSGVDPGGRPIWNATVKKGFMALMAVLRGFQNCYNNIFMLGVGDDDEVYKETGAWLRAQDPSGVRQIRFANFYANGMCGRRNHFTVHVDLSLGTMVWEAEMMNDRGRRDRRGRPAKVKQHCFQVLRIEKVLEALARSRGIKELRDAVYQTEFIEAINTSHNEVVEATKHLLGTRPAHITTWLCLREPGVADFMLDFSIVAVVVGACLVKAYFWQKV